MQIYPTISTPSFQGLKERNPVFSYFSFIIIPNSTIMPNFSILDSFPIYQMKIYTTLFTSLFWGLMVVKFLCKYFLLNQCSKLYQDTKFQQPRIIAYIIIDANLHHKLHPTILGVERGKSGFLKLFLCLCPKLYQRAKFHDAGMIGDTLQVWMNCPSVSQSVIQ